MAKQNWQMRGARKTLLMGLVTGAAFLASGCNLNQLTTNSTAPVLASGSIALDRESDVQFAREALPASLKTLETFLVSSPNNEDLLFLLTKGFNSYAFGFLEGDLDRARLDGTDEEIETLTRRAVLHYLRARSYGFRLLDYPELQEAALSNDADGVKRHLKSLTAEDVPALFWTTQAWAAAVNLAQDDPEMVGALPVIELLMERIVKLDARYMAGMPRGIYGVYFASRPVMFGGKPEAAKEQFEAALKEQGDQNLLLIFLYARFYAPQVQDRALFNRLMADILDADPTRYPDLRLSNEIARERARFWLEHADELFFE